MSIRNGTTGAVNRRAAMGAMGTMALATSVATSDAIASAHKPTLRHQVFFWLKNPESEEDRAKLISGLKKLEAIEHIRELHVGVPAETESRDVVDHSFSVSELMLFDDRDAQLAYQQHPLHLEFVAECEDLWERVVVYDSLDV